MKIDGCCTRLLILLHAAACCARSGAIFRYEDNLRFSARDTPPSCCEWEIAKPAVPRRFPACTLLRKGGVLLTRDSKTPSRAN